jgi:DNA ligase-associated metallophosphoesterase
MLIHHQGLQIELLADHAVHLPGHSVLVLSDTHFGKAATFRAHGLAIPDGDDARDLQRIDHLVERVGAEQLVIAGDLTHSPRGSCPGLDAWLRLHADRVTLVIGNHDRPGGLGKAPMRSVEALQLGPAWIVHDPSDAPAGRFSICGHLHPVVRIKDGRRRSLRLPCFHLSEHRLVLPAFGTFTGGQLVSPAAGDRVFVPLRGRVIDATPLS